MHYYKITQTKWGHMKFNGEESPYALFHILGMFLESVTNPKSKLHHYVTNHSIKKNWLGTQIYYNNHVSIRIILTLTKVLVQW